MELNKADFLAFFNESDMMEELKKQEGIKYWRPVAGKNTIRILPPNPKNGEKVHYFTHKVHWLDKKPYECLDQNLVDKDGHMHAREKCPICEIANKLRNGSLEDQKISKDICAKYKYVTRVLVRDNEEYKKTPVFYELGSKINKKIINLIQEGEWGSIVGVVDGRDFNLVKEGSGMLTSYDNSNLKPNVTPILSTSKEILDVLNKTTEMSYNSIISFRPKDVLEEAVLNASGVADALGIKTEVNNNFLTSLQKQAPSVTAQDTSIKKTPYSPKKEYDTDDGFDTGVDFNDDDFQASDLDNILKQMKEV